VKQYRLAAGLAWIPNTDWIPNTAGRKPVLRNALS